MNKVASFAYDAWIEIVVTFPAYEDTGSHRLRTMRGLKFQNTGCYC